MDKSKNSESDSHGIYIVRTASNDILNGPKLYAGLTNTGGKIRLYAPGLIRTDRHGNQKEHPMLMIARLKPIKRLLWLVCCLKSPSVVNLYLRWVNRKRLSWSGQYLGSESQGEPVPTVWVPPTDDDYAKLLQSVSGTSKTTPPINENLPPCNDVLEAQSNAGLGVQILTDEKHCLTPSGSIPQRGINDRSSGHEDSEIS